MNKLFLILVHAGLCIALVGCGPSDSDTPKVESQPSNNPNMHAAMAPSGGGGGSPAGSPNAKKPPVTDTSSNE